MVTATTTRAPDSLRFFKADAHEKGTYELQGRKYTYYKLSFEITAQDGKKFTWECCADAVNESAQGAILGIGAALKAARGRFKTADEFQKALTGGEDGDPSLKIRYSSTVRTVNESTMQQEMEVHLFEVEPLHQVLRPLFKFKDKTTVTFNDDEIRYLKTLAHYLEMNAKPSHVPTTTTPGAVLEELPAATRIRLQET